MADYYLDSNAPAGGNGLTPGGAFDTVAAAVARIAAGDMSDNNLYIAYGSNYWENLNLTTFGDGTSGHPFTVSPFESAYLVTGSSAKPTFNGATLASDFTWAHYGDGSGGGYVWSTTTTVAAYWIVADSVAGTYWKYFLKAANAASVSSTNPFYFSGTTLYVWVSADVSPITAYPNMEIPQRAPVVQFSSYCTVNRVKAKYANYVASPLSDDLFDGSSVAGVIANYCDAVGAWASTTANGFTFHNNCSFVLNHCNADNCQIALANGGTGSITATYNDCSVTNSASGVGNSIAITATYNRCYFYNFTSACVSNTTSGITYTFNYCIFSTSAGSGTYWYYNNAYPDTVTFNNCVFYHGGYYAMRVTLDGAETGSLTVKNCIFYIAGVNYAYYFDGTNAAGLTFVGANNSYYKSTAGNLMAWTGKTHTPFAYSAGGLANWVTDTSQDVASILGDPKFVDAVNGNFRLQPTSPCLKTGAAIFTTPVTDYYGNPVNPPDIGASQSVGGRGGLSIEI